MVSRKVKKVEGKQLKAKADVKKKKSSVKNSATKEIKSDGLEQKDKLHRVRKNRKRSRSRRTKVKKEGLKLHVLNTPLKSIANKITNQNSLKKCSLKELNTSSSSSSSWGITLAGIPKDWKGSLDDITQKYEKFNVHTCGIARQNFEKGISKVIYMYFTNKEDWKEAIRFGPRDFCGKTLTLRTNPVRKVYISGIPLVVNEEIICSDLKEALGPTVYDIHLPSENEKKLGYAVAYVVDDDAREDILNSSLNLWEKVQCCCSEADFFKRFALNVLSGWDKNCPDIMEDLLETLQEMDIEVCFDPSSKKLFFTTESSVLKALKKSGMLIQGKKIILSQSPKVNFIIKNLPKVVKKNNIQNLLFGIQAYNLTHKKGRCKACFDVPVEDVKKCVDLHQTDFLGRKIEVLQSDSEELKLSKEMSRKSFHELLTKNKELGKPKKEWPHFAKLYLKMKQLKSSKMKRISNANENKSKSIKKRRHQNKVQPSPLSRLVKMINKRK